MCIIIKLYFLISFLVLTIGSQSPNENLVALIQVFRHGQRTPTAFYTNDQYQNKSYWGGLDVGQLTNEGKRQHFALGQFTRNRYSDWLPSAYDKDFFRIQTTDVDRTHMSAQANLNGLWPAKNDQVWRSGSDWQPIPIHPTDPNIFDGIPSNCEAYSNELMIVFDGEDFQKINDKYADLYAYLTEKSGDIISNVLNVSTIYDCLKIEHEVGLQLPDWAANVYPQPIKNATGYLFDWFSHNTKLQRLAVGPLFFTIFDLFENLIKDPNYNPKFQIYSGHDTNISPILNTLGVFDPPQPPAFASSIYIELRRNNTGDHYINVWSKNEDDFQIISIRGCAMDCPFNETKLRLQDILVDINTWKNECANDTITNEFNKYK